MLRRLSSTILLSTALASALAMAAPPVTSAAQPPRAPWRFVVAGDSRNCGDIVMPAIAALADERQAAFYWHLGDLRAIFTFDEDLLHQPEHLARPMTIADYLNTVWTDAIDSQLSAFGDRPVMLGIGNHETIPPKTRDEFALRFADWLDAPGLRAARLADDPKDHRVKTYFHWIDRGIAFYYLDNASAEQFDATQLRWFERLLAKDAAAPAITSIVVGMHEALPESFSASHSMDESAVGIETGRRVYVDLLKVRDESHKHVYVLASHSHYYMENAYDTPYGHEHGGVLPGWVVGTAGAQRYALPRDVPAVALTNVYGALVGTAEADGTVGFEFKQFGESDIPAAIHARYGDEFVHWCFVNNTQAR